MLAHTERTAFRNKMRTVALTLAFLLAASVCFALDITTRKGVTYKQCAVTKVDPDGIRITHTDGAAKIVFEDLPDALQRQYNYDPAKVAEYRKRAAEAQAAAAKQAADELAQRQAAEFRAQQQRDALTQQQRQQEQQRLAAEQQKANAEANASEETQRTAIRAGTGIGIGLILLGLAVYFLPTIVAIMTGKQNTLAIFILNLFLGWTLVGWVIALVWACTKTA